MLSLDKGNLRMHSTLGESFYPETNDRGVIRLVMEAGVCGEYALVPVRLLVQSSSLFSKEVNWKMIYTPELVANKKFRGGNPDGRCVNPAVHVIFCPAIERARVCRRK